MLNVKLVGVDFDFIKDINCNFNKELDFNKSGLYKVFLGSRNIIEEIEYISINNELNYKSKEELIKESIELEGNEDNREYFEEFCDSYCEDNKVVYELVNEEECFCYFYLNV